MTIKIFVSCKGDPSVGLPGTSATIAVDGDFLMDHDSLSDGERAQHA